MYNMILCQLVMSETIGFLCLPALQIHYKSLDNLHDMLFKVVYHYALHRADITHKYLMTEFILFVFKRIYI